MLFSTLLLSHSFWNCSPPLFMSLRQVSQCSNKMQVNLVSECHIIFPWFERWLCIFFIFFFLLCKYDFSVYQLRFVEVIPRYSWRKPWTCAFERSAYKHPIPPHPVPSSKFRLQINKIYLPYVSTAYGLPSSGAIYIFWAYSII